MAEKDERGFSLELENAAFEIKKSGAKSVCIQLPSGLKSRAADISDYFEKNTSAEIFIWGSSCFGACDVPNLGPVGIDLIIQWGHSEIF